MPSALRWGLAFGDEGKGLLALARAVPRAWFARPNSNLTVTNAPVSRQLLADGVVSFSLQRQGTAHAVVASVHTGAAGPGLQNLSLAIRMPSGWGQIKRVTSGTGEDWTTRLQPAKKGVKINDVLVLNTPSLPTEAALMAIAIEF